MNLTIIPIVVILLAIFFTFYISIINQRRHDNRLKWVLVFLRNIRKLIQHLPQHRGMANAYLKGDNSFKEKMSGMHNTIDADFSDLLLISQESGSIFNQNIVNPIHNKWEEIKSNAFTFSPEESFSKHTEVITDLLNVMEDSSELTSLQSGYNEFHLIVRAVIKDIPHLTETLGQSRGIGTGVAAQLECSVANRLKLGFLQNKSMKVLNDTVQPLIDSRLPQLQSSQKALESCLEKAKKFLVCMDSELVKSHKIEISSKIFYDTATEAIDQSFLLLDQLLDVLENIVVKK